MLIDEYFDKSCICEHCGKVISYDEYHRNDLEPMFMHICYNCETRMRYGK